MRIRYIYILLLFLSVVQVSAQTPIIREVQNDWQFRVTAGGGPGYLKYDAPDGNLKKGMGYVVDLQFQRFHEKWGYGAGIQMGSLNNTLTFDELNTSEYSVHVDNGWPYTKQTRYTNLKEVQELTLLQAPVQLLFRAPLSDIINLQAGFGVIVGVVAQSSYTVESGTITTSGYFSATNVTYSGMPNHGFGDYKAEGSGTINANLNMGLCLDFGLEYRITPESGFYGGFYVQSGLNPFVGKKPDRLSDGSRYRGYLNSSQLDGARSMQVGFKFGIIMGPRE